MTQPIYEGAAFKADLDRLALAWMPSANWGEVAGPNAPLAYADPRHVSRAMVDYLRGLSDGVPWFIDMGGWSILRSFLPARGATVADVCRGLDTGTFPCALDVALQAEFFKDLRGCGIRADQVGFYFDDGDEFSLWSERWNDVTDPFADVRAAYLGGKTIANAEVDRRFHQTMVNTHKHMIAALGFDPERIVVAGCAAVAPHPIIDTPISHIWAGDWPGASADQWNWAWKVHADTVAILNSLGKKSWVHLSSAMPPEQAARGASLGSTYTAVFCERSPDMVASAIGRAARGAVGGATGGSAGAVSAGSEPKPPPSIGAAGGPAADSPSTTG